jgi:hypothetical protein
MRFTPVSTLGYMQTLLNKEPCSIPLVGETKRNVNKQPITIHGGSSTDLMRIAFISSIVVREVTLIM